MKKVRCLLFFLFLLLFNNWVIAQKKTITGKVIDKATGEPLIGANVLIEKVKGGVTTKEDGSYSISLPNGKSVLIFSYVGYASQLITVGTNTTINVELVATPSTESEVIVIGYGTQKKSSVTGSVVKYKNERLDEVPVARLDQALQGKMAGVQIQNLTSEAGAAPKINIRGTTSISAGSNPLVVVDGHPVPDGLAFVNMADVESVEVLKDAASSAIYGSRGANGVILITTKEGKADKARYNLKASSGIKSSYKLHPLMSVTEFTKLHFDEAALRANDPTVPVNSRNLITPGERASYVIEQTLLDGKGTDWQKEAVRDANMSNVQLSVSGGKKEVKYFVSGSYQKDDGLMHHSSFNRLTLRARLDMQLGKKVKLNLNFNPSYSTRERPATSFIDFYRFYSFLPVKHTDKTAAFVNQSSQWAAIRPGDWAQARHFSNFTYSGLMPDGTTWSSGTSTVNPFNTSNNSPKSIMETRSINSADYRALNTSDLTITLAKDLDFKSKLSAFVSYTDGLDFTNRNSTADGLVNRGVYNTRLFIDLLTENTLSYNKKVKAHSFNFLAGFTAQKTLINESQTTGIDFPSDNIRTLNTALQIDQSSTNSFKNQIGLLSYLGRVNYSYNDKYLFTASFRTDGSSYFAPGRKWGSFPAVSLGWVASKEKFIQNVNWISQLKFRASYGATGNNAIADFAFVDLLYPSNYAFGSGVGTTTLGVALSRDILSNPNITWERTFAANFGVDISMFKSKINLTIDVYQSKTDQLLLRQASMGFTGVNETWNNIGKLRNSGIEFELSTNNVVAKHFTWKTSANISFNTNKLLELGGESFQLNYGERNEIYRAGVDNQLVQFYGYKTAGVWQSQAEIDDARAKGLTSNLTNYFTPGGLKLQDINNDNKIDVDDRTQIGSPLPKFTWGITNNFTYKAFDVSFLLQGVQGVSLINGDAFYNESRRLNKNYTANRWVSAMYPGDGKTPYFNNGFNQLLTDYVVEDGSYMALRELTIGYKLPTKVASIAKLSGLRFYCSVQNAFVIMANGYRGINPEARLTTGAYATPLILGYQRGGFPMPRTILFGLDINF